MSDTILRWTSTGGWVSYRDVITCCVAVLFLWAVSIAKMYMSMMGSHSHLYAFVSDVNYILRGWRSMIACMGFGNLFLIQTYLRLQPYRPYPRRLGPRGIHFNYSIHSRYVHCVRCILLSVVHFQKTCRLHNILIIYTLSLCVSPFI